MDDDNIETLHKDELKRRLRELELSVSGLKTVLCERLRAALQKSESDNEMTDEKDETEENKGEAACRKRNNDDIGGTCQFGANDVSAQSEDTWYRS